ncbi:class I SAM-dependent methyltransferase [Clostridium fungisolvens]|uniref:Ribosomal RNA small subunit methyltransferase A n=1 Tax=Clostridium fungisolvens TaxID=1604897 RepID=A0A6V8SMT5_9CLOT|nr:class I SAM-dependent methyltransferase [Clostridium fungisolvens]GFP76488.1 Ribosomal RNA small subunit methyltransferase A [Clostridium fungisolvens]
MDKRLTFNEDASNYDKWRPTYCEELFEDIFRYSEISKDKNALEVGIGTGQATTPFLNAGYNVTAVELGNNLAEFSREKFKEYKNFKVYNTSFEEFQCEDNIIDILYSATAFHWIPESIGYPKILRLLKDNGTIALFWNKPSPADEEYSLHLEIQKIYEKYWPSTDKLLESNSERYKRISETIKTYGFRDLEMKLYHKTRKFSSEEYICLLNTYSDHRTMPEPSKQLFENEIKDIIKKNGNLFDIHDTIELYLARK